MKTWKNATLNFGLCAATCMLLAFAVNNHSGVHAAAGFTAATLKGNYAFDESGTVGGNKMLNIGLINFDGNGGVSGTANVKQSETNATQTATFTGIYTVNPDGSGTMTINYSLPQSYTNPNDGSTSIQDQGFQATYNVVITSSGHLRAVRADEGTFVTSSFEKQTQDQ